MEKCFLFWLRKKTASLWLVSAKHQKNIPLLPAVINASLLTLSSQGGKEVTALAAPTTNLALVIHGLLQTLIAVCGKTGSIL